MKNDLKEQLARAVCLFLAEMLRTRKVSLKRGAEIAAAIVVRLDEIDTELEFLEATKQLELEFQELQYLERDLTFYHKVSEREKMERLVREFAIHYLPDNPTRAVQLMEEALRADCSLEELTAKFSDFAEFAAVHA